MISEQEDIRYQIAALGVMSNGSGASILIYRTTVDSAMGRSGPTSGLGNVTIPLDTIQAPITWIGLDRKTMITIFRCICHTNLSASAILRGNLGAVLPTELRMSHLAT